MTWAPVPVRVETDLEHGGRWTSLRSEAADGDREWLWRNPGVSGDARATARPGEAFVDAGGGEECFPSVVGPADRGHDHGDVWCRPWSRCSADGQDRPGAEAATVATGPLTLRRSIATAGGAVEVRYRLRAERATGVLHAVHLLLELGEHARVLVPGAPAVRVQDRPGPGEQQATVWPDGDGVRLDALGPADGTARCAVVATDRVAVVDGDHRLSLQWRASAQPLSLVMFRNLGGWPEQEPYRSVAVEPLLGAAIDRDRARPGELARLDPETSWSLTVSAAVRRRP